MRAVRILFSVIVLIAVVLAIAIGCLMAFINPNKLKPVITEQVMQQTGYELTIDGDLSWSFYPKVGIRIAHMTVKAPQQSAPFLELNDVRAAADLKQLLHGVEKLQGDVYVDTARLTNLHVEKVNASLRWENKVLTVQPLTASLYDGTLSGIAAGRDLAIVPEWNWDVQFTHVQLNPLLKDLNGTDSKIRLDGLGDIKLQGSTKGKTRDEILKNINGSSEFSLNNGKVEGINLNFMVQSAEAIINKQPLPQPQGLIQTEFNSLTGSAVIKEGVITTNNLLLVSSAFITKGTGTISLVSEEMDLNLQVKPQQNLQFQWEIPLILSGNLKQPQLKLDTVGIGKLIAEQDLEKLKEKASQVIKKHVPGEAGKFLQNLIGK